jgi:hypothetical protein
MKLHLTIRACIFSTRRDEEHLDPRFVNVSKAEAFPLSVRAARKAVETAGKRECLRSSPFPLRPCQAREHPYIVLACMQPYARSH